MGQAVARTSPPYGGGGYYPYYPYYPPSWYYTPGAWYGYGAIGLGYFYYDPFWWGYTGYGYPYYGGSYYGSGYYGGAGYYGGSYGVGVGYSGGGSGGTYYGSGHLRLKVKPRDAEVYVDGYFMGLVDDYDGTFQKLELDSGPHRVEVRKPGFTTLLFDVRVPIDETVTYRGEMRSSQ